MPTTRGTQPASVYWRRRALVLGTVLALVLIVVNLVRDPKEPDADGTAVQAAAQPDAAQTGGDKPRGRKRGNDAGRGRPVPDSGWSPTTEPDAQPEPPEPTGECAAADVRVTPSVPGAVAERPVTFRLTLRTVEAEACTWAISRTSLAVRVTDGEEEMWSIRQCGRLVPSSIVVRRDFPAAFDLTWDARRATLDCPDRQPWVEPGDYEVQVSAVGGEPSEPVAFTLADPDDVAAPPQGPLGPEVPGGDDPDRKDKGAGKGKGKNGTGKNGTGKQDRGGRASG